MWFDEGGADPGFLGLHEGIITPCMCVIDLCGTVELVEFTILDFAEKWLSKHKVKYGVTYAGTYEFTIQFHNREEYTWTKLIWDGNEFSRMYRDETGI